MAEMRYPSSNYLSTTSKTNQEFFIILNVGTIITESTSTYDPLMIALNLTPPFQN